MKTTKKCVFCGRAFTTNSGMRKYCSVRCADEAKKAKKKRQQDLLNAVEPVLEIQYQEYLTFSKAAILMGCSRQYIYKLVAQGRLRASRISNRINMFEELFETLNSGYSIENIRYAMSLFHHYLASLRYVHQYRSAGEKIDEGNVVEAAIHYMKENIERHMTLQEVADFTGYSASHFSMLFKAKTGHSPLNYINLLKIQRACLLLDTTQMRMNQICHKLGMDDPYYFSRLFSKIMGMSPRAYRTKPKA